MAAFHGSWAVTVCRRWMFLQTTRGTHSTCRFCAVVSWLELLIDFGSAIFPRTYWKVQDRGVLISLPPFVYRKMCTQFLFLFLFSLRSDIFIRLGYVNLPTRWVSLSPSICNNLEYWDYVSSNYFTVKPITVLVLTIIHLQSSVLRVSSWPQGTTGATYLQSLDSGLHILHWVIIPRSAAHSGSDICYWSPGARLRGVKHFSNDRWFTWVNLSLWTEGEMRWRG